MFTQDIKILIQQDFDINMADKDGCPPLSHAVTFCCFDVIEEMLLKGANAKNQGKDGNNVLHSLMGMYLRR